MRPAEPIDPEAVTDDLFEMGAGRSVADPAPRADASHPLVAKVLAVTPVNRYGQVLTRSSELTDPEEWGDPAPIAARQIGVVLRGLAEHRRTHGGYPSWSLGDLDDLADEIDPPEATP